MNTKIVSCTLAALLFSADVLPQVYINTELQKVVVENQWKGKKVAFFR